MDEPTLSEIEEAEALIKSELAKPKKPLPKKKKAPPKKEPDAPKLEFIDEEPEEGGIEEIPLDKSSMSIPKPVNGRRPPLKRDLIDNIMKLQEHLAERGLYEPQSKYYYDKKKVAELEVILGDMMNLGTTAAQEEQFAPQGQAPVQAQAQPIALGAEDIGKGSALYQFNLIAAHFLELGSVHMEERMGTSLKGLTEDVRDHQAELEACLREVYAEHRDVLAPYITGTNRYFLLMGGLMSKRLMLNKKKKDSPSQNGQDGEVEV